MMIHLGHCLWFDDQAQEAAEFYCSIVPNSRVLQVSRYAADTPSDKPLGSVLTVEFELDGVRWTALNGGPHFRPDEAFSFVVRTDTQEESDHYWDALREGGGEESMCGWLKDRFGVSWQVYPTELDELTTHADPEVARRATEVMLTQRKIEMAPIREAALGG
ncbi:glyoxalase family protein [Serinicoccus profundi]|uniref:glyoxalase family protein n=1 Tax=Serinicoccus profundi TaxID=1078471 RepID=UPI000255E4D9